MDKHTNHLLALTIPGPNGGSTNIVTPLGNPCGPHNDCFNFIMQYVIQLLFGIAILLALAFLIWGGIDWIMSRGDKQRVQKARMKLIYSIIGLIIVFLAFFIVNLFGTVLGLHLTNSS